ncbi:DUF6118 family protein [Phenylobacterium sp. VNQ135]|uniref:DUF6118 family protein n=1 Tax=Phenylobacterium sp. VNQ135 TaxID=3400922 RepID=UPI003C09BCBC
MGDQQEPQDAAEAFEQLRREVAELGVQIERLPTRMRGKAPDFSETFAAIIGGIRKIETHPALQLTPERFNSQAKEAAEALRRVIEPDLRHAVAAVDHASRDVARFAGELRSREAQRNAVVYAGAGGLVAGAVLWGILAGPLARLLPQSWQVPEKMAAATLHLDRWEAGSRLMQSADPASWKTVVSGAQLWRDNRPALEGCLKAAEKMQKAETCKVVVAGGSGPKS